ncbi:sulfite exporter TauE/SafE family protein [Ancylomarina longa]|uniref:Probable membrane transporter protein n=1 Tax=Ancylomarina longa TaxID=2487017 RepID=A0A434AXA4_9BACT|nr:sulfite exporter TauE/SafE family protein [Ancylomarina longa]RUT79159.1 sulfite exporter TauE/SafE family protein [Ancylomarina longa]
MEYFWIILIVALASLIKGITGFGFALVSLPLLMFWYAPKELIPILFLCNLFASIIIVLQKKNRKLVNKQFKSLIIFGALFTTTGVVALHFISDNGIITVISVFLIILSILSFINVKYSLKLTDISYKIAGALLGFVTGFISISGPPLALFLNSADTDNQTFREVFSWFSIVTACIALMGYALLGLLTTETIKMTLLFLPILFAGTYFGKRLNSKIPPTIFKKAVVSISLIASVLLLIK